MRVKFYDSTSNAMDSTTIFEITGFYLEDDSNKLILYSNGAGFESERPLSSTAEKYQFQRWADSLLTNGFADLTTIRDLNFVQSFMSSDCAY